MNDVLPDDSSCMAARGGTVRRVLDSYGYGELRLPLVEPTALFSRSIGDATDIVEKEMYSFRTATATASACVPEVRRAACARRSSTT
jgi:histidyl-tRNA synthetase